MKPYTTLHFVPVLLLATVGLLAGCSALKKKEATTTPNTTPALTTNETACGRNATAPKIKYAPKDGVIRIYGAGGPQTAMMQVADRYEKETGRRVVITFGPEAKWTKAAQADADIIWGTAEHAMTAFLQTYTAFAPEAVEPIYMRPAAIAVQKGNPKHIQGIADLLKPGMRIVVVEGAGVYNTSGTAVWEDVVGRLGRLEDVKRFRKNIIDYALGSGAGFKAFKENHADAWLTWNYWGITQPDAVDLVAIEPERAIYRDLTVVTNDEADPEARDFIAFLKSPAAVAIFSSEGWLR